MRTLLTEPMTLYHGTGPGFTDFEASKMLHLGTVEQAMMRQRGVVVGCLVGRLALLRKKDRGGDWKRQVTEIRSKGLDGVVYLNRYEGIPRGRFAELEKRGYTHEQLNKLPDSKFKALVPEAQDSYLLLDKKRVIVATVK